MTTRQQKFVDFYIASGNASEAARRAGYKGASNRIGSRLLTKIDIKAQIEQKNKQASSRRIASARDLKEFFTNVVNDPDAKLSDRIRAGELLAKTKGLFLDRVQISGVSKLVGMPDPKNEPVEE